MEIIIFLSLAVGFLALARLVPELMAWIERKVWGPETEFCQQRKEHILVEEKYGSDLRPYSYSIFSLIAWLFNGSLLRRDK